jgi:hypothetical protein
MRGQILRLGRLEDSEVVGVVVDDRGNAAVAIDARILRRLLFGVA